MRTFIRALTAPLTFSLVMLAAGCGERAGEETELAQDTTLARDLELANRDTAAEPQLSDVPAPETAATATQPEPAPERPAPTRTRPAPKPAPPAEPEPEPTATAATKPTTTPSGNTVEKGSVGSEGEVATIAAGTNIALTSSERVCTNTHKAGDRFTATVTEPVTGSNGAVIPAGATAVVQVTSVQRSGNTSEPIKMGFVVQTISYGGKTYPISAKITDIQVDRVRASSRGSDAGKVIGGAVAGAILGQILGKDTRSTVIGAATGAAAGTAVAMGTADYEGCVPEGGKIAISLTSPATVQAE